jgi:hypothetical protein
VISWFQILLSQNQLNLYRYTREDVPALFKHIKQGRYEDAKVLFKRGVVGTVYTVNAVD